MEGGQESAWRCMARFRTLRHPASRDHRRVHWASAKGRQSWAILGNLVSVDEEDQRRQSAVESWERKYIAAKKIDCFGT